MKTILTFSLVLLTTTMTISAPCVIVKKDIISPAKEVKNEVIKPTESSDAEADAKSIEILERGRRILEYKYNLYG